MRGAGQQLQRQSQMFTSHCRPGARIEHVRAEVKRLKDSEHRHLVVMVGTNQVKDKSEEIFKEYKLLIDECKKVKHRKISVVGIPRRYDVSALVESRRLGVNERL